MRKKKRVNKEKTEDTSIQSVIEGDHEETGESKSNRKSEEEDDENVGQSYQMV